VEFFRSPKYSRKSYRVKSYFTRIPFVDMLAIADIL
jgi:hypothetical protein